jgi:toxin FitB
MFLLDKLPSGRANAGVAAWSASVSSSAMFLSVISLHELELGVLLAERSDAAKGQVLRTWLNETVRVAFNGRILVVDEEVALQSSALHVPDPAPYRDAFIGATSMVHAMTVVTRNARDFERFPAVDVFNPWT